MDFIVEYIVRALKYGNAECIKGQQKKWRIYKINSKCSWWLFLYYNDDDDNVA